VRLCRAASDAAIADPSPELDPVTNARRDAKPISMYTTVDYASQSCLHS
jgi:hypothetical protein